MRIPTESQARSGEDTAITERALVTGAGGFIGHHLVRFLKDRDHWVRGVDLKEPKFEPSPADEYRLLDLRDPANALAATEGVDHIYHLAADMGGIGYISTVHAAIAHNSSLINLHTLEAARQNDVGRLLFSSSACIYPQYLQQQADVSPLKESDAWPADPEPGYGLEKLYMEKLCEYYLMDHGLQTRIVRFHNVFGPLGPYEGGKEKAPAAICRKVALADDGDEIEIWGDGNQTRTFMYIDDCLEGLYRIMKSDYPWPLNLGREEVVTINEMVDIVSSIAGKTLKKRHDVSRPQGVRGRSSDNTLLREEIGWSPQISLREGLDRTYHWIAAALGRG